MTSVHFSPIYLRRMFNLRSELMLKEIFGPRFRVWLELHIRACKGQITFERLHQLYARWMAMHRKQIENIQNDIAPSV